ncbi:nucleotidyl transferase AbiEii/AbiGii toxin family protein [Bacteroides sp. 14(A)]|uniref:nucleotidyl transferase AbiEii/AbiGii toxin family protein n=1 Tax=Bacteroides sp. 14(A) TaxID=1163670 RepID=UPI0004785451|nr:nucleotidyl transferase AbiEii/AbiGii toxin family protein [Bacteroides sp. 14(A)]
MNLHENKKLFTDAVLAASESLDIRPVYIEKDYWITRTLKLMVQNSYAEKAIFKGGTSLSKAHKIGNRFSEDIDIAISDADTLSGNQLKMLIKKITKEMTSGLEEVVVPGVTSKGSRYYKAMYSYPNVLGKAIKETVNIGQLLVEINSFANPYPYVSRSIDCFIAQFFRQTSNDALVEEYGLEPFSLNVLDKRQTLTEKLVSLIRFSLSDNYIYDVAAKIRHFYDLHFLLQDEECATYLQSEQFKMDFSTLLAHDRATFDKPDGWNIIKIEQSPLLSDFPNLWENLKETYLKELPAIAFSEIPKEDLVASSFEIIAKNIL